VNDNVYVDNALVSVPDEKSAVNLMKKTKERLKKEGKLRLHKISVNSGNALASFPQADLAKDLCEMDFSSELANVQRSLRLCWEVGSDTFAFQVCDDVKPYTKRGLF
jgi:hypothetical protein